jgi:hypothetical protein
MTVFKGTWQRGTHYYTNDLILTETGYRSGEILACTTEHTSAGRLNPAYWQAWVEPADEPTLYPSAIYPTAAG